MYVYIYSIDCHFRGFLAPVRTQFRLHSLGLFFTMCAMVQVPVLLNTLVISRFASGFDCIHTLYNRVF